MKIIIYRPSRFQAKQPIWDSRGATAGYRLRIVNGLLQSSSQNPDVTATIASSSLLGITYEVIKVKLLRHKRLKQPIVLIVHKNANLRSLYLFILFRVAREQVLFDFCDVPYTSLDSFNCLRALVKAFIFSWQCRLSTFNIASSLALKNSIDSNCAYIDDVIDSAMPSYGPLYRPELPNLPFTIFWYGSSGKIEQHFGLIELISHVDEILIASRVFKFELSICSNFQNLDPSLLSKLKEFESIVLCHGVRISYHEWGTDRVLDLFLQSDLCYLPCVSSLKTYAKSPNRALLSLQHQVPTLVGYRDCYVQYADCENLYLGKRLEEVLSILQCPKSSSTPDPKLTQDHLDASRCGDAMTWSELLSVL